MKRALWIAVSLALGAVVTLSVVRPHQMVSPGDLIPAHASLQGDCFACHAPLRGASSERCIACHAVKDIGLRTTKGVAIARSQTKPPFHQALTEPDCMACHSDHPPPRLTTASTVHFDHAMLNGAVRAQCQSCHKAPADDLHRGQALTCAACHRPPQWKPATFDHSRYFRLDGDHNTACTTCHLGGDYKRYTCYGCHEHQPARMIAKHREEGITNIEDCVRCHRTGEGEGEEREGRRGEDD